MTTSSEHFGASIFGCHPEIRAPTYWLRIRRTKKLSPCKSSEIVDTMRLAGKSCPYCKEGVFLCRDFAIS